SHQIPLTRWSPMGECRDRNCCVRVAVHGTFVRLTAPSIIFQQMVVISSIKRGAISMPRKLPPFVECWRDRHKKVRVYFRKGKGPRIPLPGHIGSNDFNAAYQGALAGQIAGKRERREPEKPGTIAALIRSYMRSAAYVGLRNTTKAGYSSRIEMLRTQH